MSLSSSATVTDALSGLPLSLDAEVPSIPLQLEQDDDGWNPFATGASVGSQAAGDVAVSTGAGGDDAAKIYDVRIRPMTKKVTRDRRDDIIEREAGASKWGDLPWVSLGKGKYMVGVRRVIVDEDGRVHLAGSKAKGSMTVTDFLTEWGEKERRRHGAQRAALTMLYHKMRS